MLSIVDYSIDEIEQFRFGFCPASVTSDFVLSFFIDLFLFHRFLLWLLWSFSVRFHMIQFCLYLFWLSALLNLFLLYIFLFYVLFWYVLTVYFWLFSFCSFIFNFIKKFLKISSKIWSQNNRILSYISKSCHVITRSFMSR